MRKKKNLFFLYLSLFFKKVFILVSDLHTGQYLSFEEEHTL